jgi:hypothetical protein
MEDERLIVKALEHDLRQDRAKLISDTLESIHVARKEKDFPTWFEELINLRSDVIHKFKKEDTETYFNLEKDLRKAISDQTHAYQDKKADQVSRGMIEDKLRALNEFLIAKMDKYQFFGEKARRENL